MKTQSWFHYFFSGLKRTPPRDQLDEKEKELPFREKLKILTPFVARHWRKAIAGAVVILLGAALSFPVPLIYRHLVDRVILEKQLGQLAGVLVLYIGLKLSGVLLGAWQQFFFTRFEQFVLLDIQSTLLERTLRLPKAYLDTRDTGYLMSRILGDVRGLQWFFSSTLIHILSSILRLSGGVIFLFLLNWKLAAAVIVALPLMLWSMFYFSRRLRILSHHGMENQAQVVQSMEESLASTTLIKSFVTEQKTTGRVSEKLHTLLQTLLEQHTMRTASQMAIGTAPAVSRLLVLAAGAWQIIEGHWTLGSLLAFQSYMGFVFGPARFLATTQFQFQGAMASLDRVSTLMAVKPESETGGGLTVDHLQGAVDFQEVSFSYDRTAPVLSNVSFSVQPGEQVTIVGPSGVGKSTLLSLIMRFYTPHTGEIRYDGRSAGDYDLYSLRRRIGYVCQSPQLLSGSILDNILYGDECSGETEAVAAAKTAGIHDFIESLPKKYHTPVTERGNNLSEGQKQRLSIARALVRNPDILIFDEPTSALDGFLEKTVLDALTEMIGGKTLLIVAHRPATIERARRILLFREGRLIGDGSFDDLRRQFPGSFSRSERMD